MKERPILFSAPMVRAILDGRKTQTRRVVKGCQFIEKTVPGVAPYWRLLDHPKQPNGGGTPMGSHVASLCPYGQPGDQLWVRETWQGPLIDEELEEEFHQSPDYFKKPEFCAYRATDTLDAINADGEALGWRPSIHMPRWASRILLEVTSVRVERLQDISEADAEAEGPPKHFNSWRDNFCALWQKINGDGSWDANPWVWAIEFNRMMP